MERWAGDKSAQDLAGESEMQYISKRTLELWINAVSNFQSGEDYNSNTAKKFNQIRRTIINELHSGGVGILLGSDAPQVFNVPGFSIQHELRYLVACGLTPYETLQTGTTNPAKFFGQEKEYGMVKAGQIADLVLLNSNPLENIEAFVENEGVMVNGQWLSKNMIQERLTIISQKYK